MVGTPPVQLYIQYILQYIHVIYFKLIIVFTSDFTAVRQWRNSYNINKNKEPMGIQDRMEGEVGRKVSIETRCPWGYKIEWRERWGEK